GHLACCAVHSDSNSNSLCQLRGAPSSMARCADLVMKQKSPSGSCASRRPDGVARR
ncbi:hypothetical protein A2U01_0055237, partial [Trifolium medium]|nr:hypothetical protein [Trifolium medium]